MLCQAWGRAPGGVVEVFVQDEHAARLQAFGDARQKLARMFDEGEDPARPGAVGAVGRALTALAATGSEVGKTSTIQIDFMHLDVRNAAQSAREVESIEEAP